MTDQSPAYAQAIDQLRSRAEAAEKERDQLRAQLQTGDYLLRPAPPTISEVMLQGALQRAEGVEKRHAELVELHTQRCDDIAKLTAQLDAVTAERDAAIERATERYWRAAYDDACAELTGAKCRIADLEAANATVTAENADLAQKLSGNWIEREVDARVMSDFKERTGPTAFERNQLRDEVTELRPQVEDLRTKLAAAEHRAAMHERDADEASRAVTVLSTIIRASVEAIARGVK